MTISCLSFEQQLITRNVYTSFSVHYSLLPMSMFLNHEKKALTFSKWDSVEDV